MRLPGWVVGSLEETLFPYRIANTGTCYRTERMILWIVGEHAIAVDVVKMIRAEGVDALLELGSNSRQLRDSEKCY